MTSGDLAVKPSDPLLHDIALPLGATCFPIGFPMRLRTNSHHVLESAAESWGMYTEAEFSTPPLDIRIVIRPDGIVSSPPVFASQTTLLTIVADHHNFGAFDTRSFSGFCHLSENTARDHGVLRYYYLEAAVYFLLSQRYIVPIHAACIARHGKAVLLCGVSGSGKSTLSFACARAGWTYLSDDCTWLMPDTADLTAIGKPHAVRFRDDAPHLFPELAGYASRPRNGKLTIEVPTDAFPEIQTSRRATIGSVVLLERGTTPSLRRIPSREAVDALLADTPIYEPEVNAMNARTIARLASVPAHRLCYRSFNDGLPLLAELL